MQTANSMHNNNGEGDGAVLPEITEVKIGGAHDGYATVGGGGLPRLDSLHMEAGIVSGVSTHGAKHGNWNTTLLLAFQSIGVVYGDIGTSPLYVYSSTFTNGINDPNDLLGVLSLIIYTIILIPLIKGTFALYSLISRYAKVSMVPNQQAEDAMVSSYALELPTRQMRRAYWMRAKLEKSEFAKSLLFLLTILGTSMVIGDGVLTPCISVLSAVGGIKEKTTTLSEDSIAGISIAILIVLFLVQRYGTDKVGYLFAPIVSIWFLFIGGIGAYNLFKYDVGVLRAFNPKYIVDYFRRNGKQGWISLGGIVLCITGTEAMFADLGHFNIRAIQIGFSFVLFPAVSLAYVGQAAYLTKFPDQVGDTFYKSIPGPMFWPTFIIAVAAAIIASQAMISGAFAIISQSQSLGCFPRVKVVHTSKKYEGQVYIPVINYVLLIACVIVTAAFKTTEKIGHAYGIAVVCVMFITTMMVTIIMVLIWKTSIWLSVLFFVILGGVELIYLSSVLYKFDQGGYLPLAFASVLMIIMGVWHYVHVGRYKYELRNKVSSTFIRDLSRRLDLQRLPGVGLLFSELVQGVPPIFTHFIDKIPSLHSIAIIVSVKYLPVSRVEMHERFLFRQLEPRECRIFRCVARYGYNDTMEGPHEFEQLLADNLKRFIHKESLFTESKPPSPAERDITSRRPGSSTVHIEDSSKDENEDGDHSGSATTLIPPSCEHEMQFFDKEMEKGVVYLIGENQVLASQNSNFIKKIIVNHMYNFIRKNFSQGEKILPIPQSKLLRVGMTYEL